jgi:type IV secretory pathway ATPase VirB11/archaellum biosynthesis ATPase
MDSPMPKARALITSASLRRLLRDADIISIMIDAPQEVAYEHRDYRNDGA